MKKEVCVITGCNSGIGKVLATSMARQGYEVIMLVRDSEKSVKAFEDIIRESKSHVVRLEFVDLSSLKSIQDVVKRISDKYVRIDVLINNAGAFNRKLKYSTDGLELTLAVNYYAVFALTNGLMPLIKRTHNARIVNLCSKVQKMGKILKENNFESSRYNGINAYANSKLLTLHFTWLLADKLQNTSVTVNCVHPGAVRTNVFRDYPSWIQTILGFFLETAEEGAEAPLNLATSSKLHGVTGKYFNKNRVNLNATLNFNRADSQDIWDQTQRIINRIRL